MKDSSIVKMSLYVSASISLILLAIFGSYYLYNRADAKNASDGSSYGNNGITGYGYADIKIDPDLFVLSFVVSTPSEDLAVGLQKHIESIVSLEKSLIALGLKKEDIVKSGYQHCSEYCDDEAIEVSVGPSVPIIIDSNTESDSGKITQIFKVTLKNLSQSQSVIKFLKSNKQVKFDGGGFSSVDFEEKLQEARVEATKQARENALQIAKAANLDLGEIVSIEDSTSSSYFPNNTLPITEVSIKIFYEIE